MSWDIPTGDRCPECGQPLVKTARGTVKCSNKECSYKIKPEKTEKEAGKADSASRNVPADGPDDVPPLMDEPYYDE